MYKLANLTVFDVTRLKDVSIKNIAQTEIDGRQLDLMEAYNAVKAISDDFKKSDDTAKNIDAVMWEYLELTDFFKKSDVVKATIAPDKPTASPSQKQILEAKIKGFQTALKFAKTDEEKKIMETKIKGFQTALKFAK